MTAAASHTVRRTRSAPGKQEAEIHLGNSLLHVGKLRFAVERGRQHSEFSYGQGWIEDPRSFALAPDLPLGLTPFFASSGRSGDPRESLPDAWGRMLMERLYGAGLSEFDMLTLTNDTNLGQAIASSVGVQFSDKKPTVSGNITWGATAIRAQVVAPPIVDGGMAITLRPFKLAADAPIKPTLLHGSLIDLDHRKRELGKETLALAEAGDVEAAMRLCLRKRLNVLISGGTSAGKTTFARSMLAMVDPAERLVTIEDAYELFPMQSNVVALKADRNS